MSKRQQKQTRERPKQTMDKGKDSLSKSERHNQRRKELDAILHIESHYKTKAGDIKYKNKAGDKDGEDADVANKLRDENFKGRKGPSSARRKELLTMYSHIPGNPHPHSKVFVVDLEEWEEDQALPEHFEWYYETQGQDDNRYHYLFRELDGQRYDRLGKLVTVGVEMWQDSDIGFYGEGGVFHEDDADPNKQQKKSKKKRKKRKNRQNQAEPEDWEEDVEQKDDADVLGRDDEKHSPPKHDRATKKKANQREAKPVQSLHLYGRHPFTDKDTRHAQARQLKFITSFRRADLTFIGPSPARRAELRDLYEYVDEADEVVFVNNNRVESRGEHQKRYKQSLKEAGKLPKDFDYDWYKETQGHEEKRFHYYFRELQGQRFDQRGRLVTRGVKTWQSSDIGHYDDDGTFHEDDDQRGAAQNEAESENCERLEVQDDSDDQPGSDDDVDYESERDEAGNEPLSLESKDVSDTSRESGELVPLQSQEIQSGIIDAESHPELSREDSEIPGTPRVCEPQLHLDVGEGHADAPHAETPRGDPSNEDEEKIGAHDEEMRTKDDQITDLKAKMHDRRAIQDEAKSEHCEDKPDSDGDVRDDAENEPLSLESKDDSDTSRESGDRQRLLNATAEAFVPRRSDAAETEQKDEEEKIGAHDEEMQAKDDQITDLRAEANDDAEFENFEELKVKDSDGDVDHESVRDKVKTSHCNNRSSKPRFTNDSDTSCSRESGDRQRPLNSAAEAFVPVQPRAKDKQITDLKAQVNELTLELRKKEATHKNRVAKLEHDVEQLRTKEAKYKEQVAKLIELTDVLSEIIRAKQATIGKRSD